MLVLPTMNHNAKLLAGMSSISQTEGQSRGGWEKGEEQRGKKPRCFRDRSAPTFQAAAPDKRGRFYSKVRRQRHIYY